MKKTIIALMALAGVAVGESLTLSLDSFNTSIQNIATVNNPTSYTLNFTIDSLSVDNASGFVLRLADNWGIFTQSDQYFALDNTDTNDRTWVAATSTSGTTKTWESANSTQLDSWLSTGSLTGTSVEIDVDSAGSSITLSNAGGTYIVETAYSVALSDVILVTADNASVYGAAVGNGKDNYKGVTGISNAKITYTAASAPAVPEPTTATLSLLALAGLAARRRRK